MCAPRISPCGSPIRSLTNPSLSPTAKALPLAREGELANPILSPFSFAARSVKPTLATCGWQYVQPGKTVTFFRLATHEHAVHSLNRLVARDMRQPRRSDNISGSIDPLDVRLVFVVDL